MGKNIRIVEKLDKDKWSEFVYNHPNGNIFQTPEMYEVYKHTKNYEPVLLAILDSKNNIQAILLAIIQKEYSGFIGKLTARSIIFGGPLIKNNDASILNIILQQYNKIIRNKAIYSQFRNMWDWGKLKEVFFRNNITYEEHLDILFDLTKSEEELWLKIKRDRKKGIKQSYKKDVIIKKIDVLNDSFPDSMYNIILEVYNRVKLPLPDKSFFISAFEYLKKNIILLGAFINNELIGVRVALCYKGLIYDWYAGSKEDYLSYRPNDVLPWEIIKYGINNNYVTFDFGGAGKPNKPYGVRDYKMKFGGELVNYGRFTKINKPILMKIAKYGFSMMQTIKTSYDYLQKNFK